MSEHLHYWKGEDASGLWRCSDHLCGLPHHEMPTLDELLARLTGKDDRPRPNIGPAIISRRALPVDATTPPHPVKGEGASVSQGSDDG